MNESCVFKKLVWDQLKSIQHDYNNLRYYMVSSGYGEMQVTYGMIYDGVV